MEMLLLITGNHDLARSNTWTLVTSILGWGAVICYVLSAALLVKAALKNDRDDQTRRWFKEKWERINNGRWLMLPERVAHRLLSLRLFPGQLLDLIVKARWYAYLLFISLPLFLFIGCWVFWGVYIAALIIVFPVVMFVVLAALQATVAHRAGPRDERIRAAFGYLFSVTVVALGGLSGVLWIIILLDINVFYSAILMIIMAPFYWPLLFMLAVLPEFGLSPPFFRASPAQDQVIIRIERITEPFCLGVTLGFMITFLALLIGHITDPTAYLPKTFQMTISNIVFDGLTIVVTLAILARALAKEGLLRLPCAILVSLIAAAVLACCSIYFGVFLTSKALSFGEVLETLIARSPDGGRFELSPFFWVMHTTFVPFLLYLSFILLCWLAKAFLIPVSWFLGKGKELNNPMNLTAAFCALIASVLALLAYTASRIS